MEMPVINFCEVNALEAPMIHHRLQVTSLKDVVLKTQFKGMAVVLKVLKFESKFIVEEEESSLFVQSFVLT